jgi:hypothetical protein
MKLGRFSYLFLWLFFSGLGVLSLGFLVLFGYLPQILEIDRTGFSLLIIFVFWVGWLFSFLNIAWLVKIDLREQEISDQIEVNFEKRETIASYIIRTLIALGFIGTLLGMLIITTSLGNIIAVEGEPTKLSMHVQKALQGMGTAFLTTIIGATGSTFIELLHLVFRNGYLKIALRQKAGREL